jgi:hypothetical protein
VGIPVEKRQDVTERWNECGKHLDEHGRRLFASAEAKALGHGGITAMSAITGMSATTIRAGIKEITTHVSLPRGQVRRRGGGRRVLLEHDPTLVRDLEDLVKSTTRGDPESPLLWTCKSLRHLADELHTKGHRVSHVTVGELLKDGCS